MGLRPVGPKRVKKIARETGLDVVWASGSGGQWLNFTTREHEHGEIHVKGGDHGVIFPTPCPRFGSCRTRPWGKDGGRATMRIIYHDPSEPLPARMRRAFTNGCQHWRGDGAVVPGCSGCDDDFWRRVTEARSRHAARLRGEWTSSTRYPGRLPADSQTDRPLLSEDGIAARVGAARPSIRELEKLYARMILNGADAETVVRLMWMEHGR